MLIHIVEHVFILYGSNLLKICDYFPRPEIIVINVTVISNIFKCLTCCSSMLSQAKKLINQGYRSSTSACGAMSVRVLRDAHTLLPDWLEIKSSEIVISWYWFRFVSVSHFGSSPLMAMYLLKGQSLPRIKGSIKH